MTTEERKQDWIDNAKARRARVIADGGKWLQILLGKEAAEALHQLTEGRTQVDVVTELLISAARRIRRRRGGVRSK